MHSPPPPPLWNPHGPGVYRKRTSIRRRRLICLIAAATMMSGASYAGPSVPLEFGLDVEEPACALTVTTTTGSVTADANTPSAALGTANTIDLNQHTTLHTHWSPVAVINAVPDTSVITSSAAGLYAWSTPVVARKLNAPPTGSVTCTSGTPMTLAVTTAPASATGTIGSTSFTPIGNGTTVNLPVGARLSFSNFAGSTQAVGSMGEALSATATGDAQSIAFTAVLYADSTAPLGSAYAGTFAYSYKVALSF